MCILNKDQVYATFGLAHIMLGRTEQDTFESLGFGYQVILSILNEESIIDGYDAPRCTSTNTIRNLSTKGCVNQDLVSLPWLLLTQFCTR